MALLRRTACLASSLALGAPALSLAALACAPQARLESAGPAQLSKRAHASELDFQCARAVMDRDSVYRMPLAGAETDPALAAELDVLPARARRVAWAAGLEPLLARLLSERAAASGAPSVLLLLQEQELGLRLAALDAQLTAAAFEAGCTAHHLRRLLEAFGAEEQHRQLTLAVVSLVTGAVVGTVSSVWGLADDGSDGPPILAIAGGLLATGLGAATLVHVEQSLWFEHPRNRLAPLWRGEDPEHLYPTFVFRLLTADDLDAGVGTSAALRAAWGEQIASLPAPRAANAERLLFGDGGVYLEQELALRAEMFASIESAVQGIVRDVELLGRSLVRTLTTPLAAQLRRRDRMQQDDDRRPDEVRDQGREQRAGQLALQRPDGTAHQRQRHHDP
jgi:hypothetical protein